MKYESFFAEYFPFWGSLSASDREFLCQSTTEEPSDCYCISGPAFAAVSERVTGGKKLCAGVGAIEVTRK